MKIVLLVAALVLMVSLGCGDDPEQPSVVEVFSGEMELRNLQELDPYPVTSIDTVEFTVEGNQYHLDHTTHSSNLCGSGGTVGNFGSNLITLTKIYTIPSPGCNTFHVPRGRFKAAFRSDSLILGPDTIEYVDTVNHQQVIDSLCFTFWLSK